MTRTRQAAAALLIFPLSLAGCATPLPEPRDCAMIGAAFGAAGGGAGAAEHAEDHDDGEAAGIGIASVVLGAALGYGVCALLADRDEAPPATTPPVSAPFVPPDPPAPLPVAAAPPPAPPKPPVDVCSVAAVLRGLNFSVDSAEISHQAGRILDGVAKNLEECPGKRILIEAHTDSQGSDGYNVGLSQRRARAVRDHLLSRGIRPVRLDTLGLGESQPIADNITHEGRALNRRVEVHPID